jgi:hypothetical protein
MISKTDFAPIAALDFSAIKAKLMHKTGKGWSLDRTNAIECEYRRFLYLMKTFPNEPTAPLVDVDIFWHQHILDTMKYADDCQQVFGYFLHHFPYVGMRGAADEAARQRMSERMRVIYEATFEETYPGSDSGRQVTPATAFTGRIPSEPAFCGSATAATAFCGAPAATPAFCGAPAAATAFCGSATAAATAFCGSAVSSEAAFCGAATHALGKQQAEYAAGFYSARPTLD